MDANTARKAKSESANFPGAWFVVTKISNYGRHRYIALKCHSKSSALYHFKAQAARGQKPIMARDRQIVKAA